MTAFSTWQAAAQESVLYAAITSHGFAGGPSVWGNSAFASSMAQVESAVEAAEMKAPSRWRTAEAAAAVHLWSPGVRQTARHTLRWRGAGSLHSEGLHPFA